MFQELETDISSKYPYDTQSAAHMTLHDAQYLNVKMVANDPKKNRIKEYVDSRLSKVGSI